jgi:hypothetical protein
MLGSFSGINAALGPLLAEAFADLELDHLDVRSWVRRNRALMTANLAWAIAWPPVL